MTYRGYMKDGVVVLDAPVAIPDGTPVRVDIDAAVSDFWKETDIAALAREQRVQPAMRIDDLAGDWPPEDSVDEFLALIREVRA
jgi:hypothetical protein